MRENTTNYFFSLPHAYQSQYREGEVGHRARSYIQKHKTYKHGGFAASRKAARSTYVPENCEFSVRDDRADD